MKRILILLLTLVLLISLSGVGVAETALSADSLVVLLESTFSDTDEVQLDFSYAADETLYYMYVTIDGMAAFVPLAKESDEYKTIWDSMVENLVSLNSTAGDLLKIYIPDNTPAVATFLRNDVSEDKVLFAVLSAVVVYDPVNNINLLGLE